MKNEKVVALLNEVFAGENIESINIVDDNTIEINEQTFLVFDNNEADNYYYDFQKEIIDDLGLDSFSDSFQDSIINNYIDTDYFFDIMNESNEFYLDDIENESSLTHDNRLEEEIEDHNCSTREEYLALLNSNYDNAVDWYRDNFGNKEFKEYIKENAHLIDWDSVIEECKNIDGRGIIANYDGCEIELENGYFAYRI